MTELAIAIRDLGKMYKLYQSPVDKIFDAFGINRWLFWRKHYYQEFWALRGLNLEISKGERLGIIGRNGAGKSTLLKIITGNVAPTEGTVDVKGRVQALMELGTGFHPEFTGRQNIRASLAYQGLSQSVIREKEEEIIDFSELEDFIDQPIKTYSAGMYARLAFTVATVVEPEILIIDEVLGAGDAYFAGKCVERMKRLTEESGATVLFVSHDLGSVQALCDRVIWIQKGVIAGDGKPLNIIKQYSALVRRDEEIRLRARDLKVSKKQAALLENKENIYKQLLFRLVGENGGHPQKYHQIRLIILKTDTEIIGKIEVGSPMDNDPLQMNYILDSPGLMDWGKPEKDNSGYYRIYGNFNGKYAHAPFEFSVPKEKFLDDNSNWYLEILTDYANSKLAIELYNNQSQKYEIIAILDTQEQNKFVLPINFQYGADSVYDNNHDVNCQPEDMINYQKFNSILPDQENICTIDKFDITDFNGLSTRVFRLNHQPKEIYFYVKNLKLNKIITSLYVFTDKGLILFNSFNKLVFREQTQEGLKIAYDLSSIFFGPGEYFISFALYDNLFVLDNSKEQKALALIDRGISFKVETPTEFNLNIGSIIPNLSLQVFDNQQQEVLLQCNSYLEDLTKKK
jgi:lipopolysaccharide transport system ATP-binding protein